MLRKHGVVGKFVEFYGPGVSAVPLANRATIGNMSPGVRLHHRDLPDRRGDHQLPRAHRPLRASRSRWSRRTPRSRASGTTRTPSRATPSSSSSTWPPSCRRSPARSARRTGSRSPTPRRPFRAALADYVDDDETGGERPQAGRARAGAARRRRRPRSTRQSDESFPASDAPSHSEGGNGARRARRLARPPGRRADGRPSNPAQVTARRRHRVRARPRRGGHRRDHLLHQHLQPVGDDRRRAAGQERRREGPDPQAVGQDHPGARLQGRHGLLRAGRPHAVPGQARLQPRRLRLHHLHRQLRPAHPGGQPRRSTRTTSPSSRCCPATATSRAGSTPT